MYSVKVCECRHARLLCGFAHISSLQPDENCKRVHRTRQTELMIPLSRLVAALGGLRRAHLTAALNAVNTIVRSARVPISPQAGIQWRRNYFTRIKQNAVSLTIAKADSAYLDLLHLVRHFFVFSQNRIEKHEACSLRSEFPQLLLLSIATR